MTRSEQTIYNLIEKKTNKGTKPYSISLATLSREIGYSSSQTYKSVNELRKQKLISTSRDVENGELVYNLIK